MADITIDVPQGNTTYRLKDDDGMVDKVTNPNEWPWIYHDPLPRRADDKISIFSILNNVLKLTFYMWGRYRKDDAVCQLHDAVLSCHGQAFMALKLLRCYVQDDRWFYRHLTPYKEDPINKYKQAIDDTALWLGMVCPRVGAINMFKTDATKMLVFYLALANYVKDKIAGCEKAKVTDYICQINGHDQITMNSDIEVLEFTVRTERLLRENHITTLRDLVGTSESELRAIKGLGQATINDIKQQLGLYGYRLKMELKQKEHATCN